VRLLPKAVRTRVVTVTVVIVAITLSAFAIGLLTLARTALVRDIRGALTDNLVEAQKVLDRGVVTELNLLALGQAVDPLEATDELVDRRCSEVLGAAYGEVRRPLETYYRLEGIGDSVVREYSECVVQLDPYYESVAICEATYLAEFGAAQLTFAEYSEVVNSDSFQDQFDQCLADSLLVDARLEDAAATCDPVLSDPFEGVDVLDQDAVDAVTQEILTEYAGCMRSAGVPDYPALSVTDLGEEGSVLGSVAGSSVVLPSLESVRVSVDRFGGTLGLAVPLLVIDVALLAWFAVGRALRPVDAIRRRVDEIGGEALDRRVPVTGTGDEIDMLAITMNRMLERLEKSSERQRQFVSDASHELRSPLASMRVQLEVALAHPDRAVWHDIADGVLDEGLRMERLVDDLLALARADEGVLVRRRESVDLGLLAVAEGESEIVGEHALDLSAIEEDVIVVGDSLALRRVLRNLIGNAVRHTTSRISVEVFRSGEHAVLVVEDDGAGIALDHRERVFERFTRLEEARSRDAGGAGLGLAVVAEVVAAHGGTVAVEDGTLGGARFVVRLRAAEPTLRPSQ